MSPRRAVSQTLTTAALGVGLLSVSAVFGAAMAAPRSIPPSIVVMGDDLEEAVLERPAVEFDHGRHTSVLPPLTCETCHRVDDAARFDPRFSAAALEPWDERMDAVHAACIGCHEERAEAGSPRGPETCGECHVRRPEGVPARAALAFDLSLHGRHANAYPERCETCHHVWDPDREALVYRKGAEAACRACHGEQRVGTTPSRAEAAHRACVSCHLQRTRAEADSGPVACRGCHDPVEIAQIERLEVVPRLLRDQPDRTWVAAAAGAWPAVPFDHLRHEGRVMSCSGCHHATIEPCDRCHTLQGGSEGGGVMLAEAYHDPRSTFSCVGCHRVQAASLECRGCHAGGTGETSERSCAACHSGPAPAGIPESAPEVVLSLTALGPLPPPSDELPEEVVIDGLVDRYEASRLPHGKIVRRLHTAVLSSTLAQHFHGSEAVGCSGCHHHSPVGERPPRCASCHGASNDPVTDRPDLKSAYHRQCLECHEEMNIKAVGCTDCHAAREVES